MNSMKKEKFLRIFKRIFYAACITYFPLLITLSFVIDFDDDWWSSGIVLLKLLAFTLVSFPIYVSIIGVVRFAFAVIERKSRPLWEVIAHGVLLLPCICCFASWLHIQKLMPIALWSTVILLFTWTVISIIKCIREKRPPLWIANFLAYIKNAKSSSPLPSPVFWIITISVAVLLCFGTATALTLIQSDDGHKESGFICDADFSQDSYCQGEQGSIKTSLLNRSGETYTYSGSSSDYCPAIRLVHAATETEIPIDKLPSSDDHGTYEIYDTEIRYTVFYFTVPSNAPTGEYDLYISFGDYSNVLRGVITVTKNISR